MTRASLVIADEISAKKMASHNDGAFHFRQADAVLRAA